jgi:hypothetical protein
MSPWGMPNLKPFEPSALSLDLKAELVRQDRSLQLNFSLQDPDGVVIDSLKDGKWNTWPRADELWKTTCFEAFFGIPGKPGYWEFNLSPSRQQWNLYSFDSYRQPQPPTPCNDFDLTMIEVAKGQLRVNLQSQKPIPPLEANLCAILRINNGAIHFGAQHAKQKADFHDRTAFVLKI